MAKKSPTQGGVDFIIRTMRDREATGKRKIRPKTVEDVLLPEESDDSDFDYLGEEDTEDVEEDEEEEGESGEESDKSDSSDHSGHASNAEDSSVDSGSGSNPEDSEIPEKRSKKSALRDTLKKMTDHGSNFRKAKKKRRKQPTKPKVNSSGTANKTATVTNNIANTNECSKSKSGGGITQNGPSVPTAKKPAMSNCNSRKRRRVNAIKSGDKDGVQSKGKSKPTRKKQKRPKKKFPTLSSLLERMDHLQREARKEIDLDRRICWFCLGEKSDVNCNEIIECDSCGITVHEGCYGLNNDNVSISSGTESSNSTEPWFCDACKSGHRNIVCELCPAQGGLYKETTTGRWVHLICAMYIPGITVTHDGTPNILELSYTNWGYYLCSACENEREARIGITVRCDAGFCKTYIHATCAHKAGLLSDPSPSVAGTSSDVADPYYAACKLHTNREVARRRSERYQVLREQIRIRQERKKSLLLTESEKLEQIRIKTKIEKIRSKMAAKFLQNNIESSALGKMPPALSSPDSSEADISLPWKEGMKKARMLHTTPLVNKFLSKASIIGYDVKSLELEDKHERVLSNVKRKWNVQPALNVEYAAYYADRECRLGTLTERCEKLEKEKVELIDKHAGMKNMLDEFTETYKREVEEKEEITKATQTLKDVLTLFSPTNENLSSIVIPKTPKRRPSGSVGRKSPAAKRDRRSPSSKRRVKPKNSPGAGSQSPTGRLRIVKCAVCGNSEDQHLITRCDKCKKNYHLKCLDPPLTRMPKKSRTFGWMCSDCGDESEESDHPHVDTEAPRTLRGREKLQKPNKYRSGGSPVANNHVNDNKEKEKTDKSSQKGSKSQGSIKDKESPTNCNSAKSTPLNNSDSGSGSFSEGKCHTCSKDDLKKNLVMCDKCYLEFHFVCLQPPLKYSPKRRGYSWFCAHCDEASSADSHGSLKVSFNPLEEPMD